MKNLILKYNQINESTELEDLSYNEVGRLVELGLIDEDLLEIYNYVKNGSIGDLDIVGSKLTHLPNWLTEIDEDLCMSNSNIEDIPDSLTINYSIFASHSKIKEFRKTEVFGSLGLNYTQITKLPINLKVHGELSIEGIQFEEFPKNLEIKGRFFISNSSLEQFSNKELRKMYNLTGDIIRY
jgi:Leucine-rich repeat (LRR) protein